MINIMYTSTMRLFKVLTITILTIAFTSYSNASTFSIEQLMQALAKAKPNHATFNEKKYIALLDEPIESSGELFFSAPDHLEKRTLLPRVESLIVDGNKILIERDSKTYYFTTQNLPELGALINSIRGTLAGNQKELERNFQLSLQGNMTEWTLQLVPTNTKMQKLLKQILIAGFDKQIHSIEVLQQDGDRSYMLIQPTNNANE